MGLFVRGREERTPLYPDFLGIGAQKAGTTWLSHNLQAHPQIWMPKEKELHYFDEKIELEGGLWSRLRGNQPADKRWRRQVGTRFKQTRKKMSMQDLAWDIRYFFKSPDDQWYAFLFEQGKGRVTGEITPDYSILDSDMIAHVHELMPQAKIIFMMRNPVERPWSLMDMGFRARGRSLEEASARRLYRRFDGERVRLMTDYLRTLENWGSFYPEDRIFVGFLEDVHFFPEELLGRLYDFLGVDPSFKHKVIRRKVHSGYQSTIPRKFAVYLARAYFTKLQELQECFEGY